ncbi:MAG: Rossmann-like and DUF2520 domain-containing protein [Nocardioides sp.]
MSEARGRGGPRLSVASEGALELRAHGVAQGEARGRGGPRLSVASEGALELRAHGVAQGEATEGGGSHLSVASEGALELRAHGVAQGEATEGGGSHLSRIGVVGAGRVGAVLAAALRRAGHQVTAVAAESDASRGRVAALLPGVPIDKPSAVARSADVLLLTVPDDMVSNVSSMLSASGAISAGQFVVHTSGRHGLAVLSEAVRAGARPLAIHPAMTFTGTAVDLDRLPGCVFGVTVSEPERAMGRRLVADLGGTPMWIAESHRTLYHAGLAHGANHLVTLVAEAMEMLSTAGAADPARTLRPLLSAALDNALTSGDSALTGPIARGDANTVRDHLADVASSAPHALPSYLALARATLGRAVLDGRVLPIRAAKISRLLDEAELRGETRPQANPYGVSIGE